jgi:putative aldouronate transport system substrate-binding protein
MKEGTKVTETGGFGLPSRVGRRAFLQGVLGVAGTAALASCAAGTSVSSTKSTAACASALQFPEQTVKAQTGEVLSKIPNVPPAWTSYPPPYVAVPNVPGKGGTVSTFQILYGAPPPLLGSNPFLQELNRRLGVSLQTILAASDDYPTKLATLASSGSFADITYINFNTNGGYDGVAFERIVNEGAFHDLTDYLSGSGLKEFPNLARIPAISWRGASFEGKIFGAVLSTEPCDAIIPMIRTDWMKKVGIPNPKTADDVMRMCIAFATEHPNGAGQETWAAPNLGDTWWSAMYRVPNVWRINKDGSLTKDLETEEYAEALNFNHNLWQKRAIYPDALTVTFDQSTTLFTSGKVGLYGNGGYTFFGDQPGTTATLTKQGSPGAETAPWFFPGWDGGKPLIPQGFQGGTRTANFGFAAIPSSIKDEKRIVELLHIMNYFAAPFGSEEATFLSFGIKGETYDVVNGNPELVTNGKQNWINGNSPNSGPPSYYFPNQPSEALLIQKLQEEQLATSAVDPTAGLYSPTWVANCANLLSMQTDGYNSIAVGNQPMSYLKEMISQFKSQGGEQSRKEFEKALQKCGGKPL